MKIIIFIFCLLIASTPSFAVLPDEMMADPVLESRARELGKQLRCLVCQGEDIDESNAGLAKDLRLIVRQRIAAGDSDAEALEYIRARYGDYVLMKPPLKAETFILWLLPFALLAGGVIVVFRRKGRARVRLSMFS